MGPRASSCTVAAMSFRSETAVFAELEALFDFDQQPAATQAARAVVVVEVERVADSCGYGVPLMRYEGERPQQLAWIESKLRQLSHKSRSARSPGECL
jgi:hypothetical protein